VKVGIMLEETGLAYEPHRVDLMANESHDPAFLALNPNGKVPAIYDPDEGVVNPVPVVPVSLLAMVADQDRLPERNHAGHLARAGHN
jgi:hypothetical protein